MYLPTLQNILIFIRDFVGTLQLFSYADYFLLDDYLTD